MYQPRVHTGLNIEIRTADPSEPGVRSLIDALDAYQLSLYPAESNHLDPPEALAGANVVFLCACSEDTVVACGAAKLQLQPERYAEIKRMYVAPGFRGRGLSQRLLDALESQVRARDVQIVRLETGIHQSEALGLYAAMGYSRRGPFGAYREDPLSVFMEKHLA